MSILVTGVTGFAGSYLAEVLLDRGGGPIIGLSKDGHWPAGASHLEGRIPLHECDLNDTAAVERLARSARPAQVYHVAGYAHVGRSFSEADAAWEGNLAATRSLYEALARSGCRPRVLFVGSGLVYGDPDTPSQLLHEGCLLRPNSPYAASKAAADLLSYQVWRGGGLEVVRARPFNHIGPRQSPQFAVAHFARQLVEVERGRRPPLLETGDLSPRRDFTDVRDTVAAYVLLMERGRPGEAYNVASGKTRTMQDVLDRLVALSGLTVEVRRRADLVRPADSAAPCPDTTKLRAETGWTPSHDLDQTLADTLEYWRSVA